MPRWVRHLLPPALALVGSALLAEAIVRLLRTPAWLVPRPSTVLLAMAEEAPTLWSAALVTGRAALAGFLLSALVGITLAILLSTSRWVQRAFYPYAIFFQTVPVVAIAPLVVLWFGPGFRATAILAFVVSVFPVIANTLTGLMSTDPALRDLFRLYGASPWATLTKLRLPFALPHIFTGLRIAAGLAVIGTIVGEFVAGFLEGSAGLGILVPTSIRLWRTDLLFATVLAASLLGLTLFAAVNLLAHLTLRHWHASERG